MKLIVLLVAAVLLIAACEDEGSIRNLTSFQSVPNDVRQLEFNAVQSSVVLAMVDNGVNPITPVTAPTNDMGAFPDTTWTDGTRVTAPDKPGLLLYDHDLIKNDGVAGLTSYMSDQFTRCKYLALSNGDVTWADLNGSPTKDPAAADCT